MKCNFRCRSVKEEQKNEDSDNSEDELKLSDIEDYQDVGDEVLVGGATTVMEDDEEDVVAGMPGLSGEQ